jgi:hypothetical protein
MPGRLQQALTWTHSVSILLGKQLGKHLQAPASLMRSWHLLRALLAHGVAISLALPGKHWRVPRVHAGMTFTPHVVSLSGDCAQCEYQTYR